MYAIVIQCHFAVYQLYTCMRHKGVNFACSLGIY